MTTTAPRGISGRGGSGSFGVVGCVTPIEYQTIVFDSKSFHQLS